MTEYKCINCGKIIEDDAKCQCPECGYTMYKLPYERKSMLRSEIVNFLSMLRPKEIQNGDLSYYRKDKNKTINLDDDRNRFPGFTKIQSYVCSAEKTEEFDARLKESIDELRKHNSENYQQQYEVSLNGLEDRIKEYDVVLNEALQEIDIDHTMAEVTLPVISVTYSEKPDSRIIKQENQLLELLLELSNKIVTFIKTNNIYGDQHKHKFDFKISLPGDGVYDGLFDKEIVRLKKVLDKVYMIDIFSDGADELKEMLYAVWHGIKVVMTVPASKVEFRYDLPDGSKAMNDEINSIVLKAVSDRYQVLDREILADSFLTNESEGELFDIYSNMMSLDDYGIIRLSNDAFINTGESEKKLNRLIGLDIVKDSIKKIKAYALSNKDSNDLNIHMCFYGNPGSGKTEVARIIAGILYENRILPTDNVVEVDRGGLVSQYVGETPQKTMQKVNEAMGGVLFIDEAYSLIPEEHGSWDYGDEAVATLIKAMEDYRGKFCVILAGYKNEMQKMLSSNPGFKSRIQFYIDFPNYSRNELKRIAYLMLEERSYGVSEEAMDRMLDITEIKRKEVDFANAREMRNILDQVIMNQNLRCLGQDNHEINVADVNKYIKDSDIELPSSLGTDKKLLTGDEELDALVGLSSVKRMVKKIRAFAKKNKDSSGFNMHMCFYGNPGTGKTEVARIISRILHDTGVLTEAKLVETDAHGLLGSAVGETAPKTMKKIDEADHGVLFIDEAYSLADSQLNGSGHIGYGEDAISVILKEMEDRRGDFCVIFAGYKEEMKKMISVNPGLASRIQFTLDFPDYSRDELEQILKLFLEKKGYTIDDNAITKVLDITDYYRTLPNFANARTVRNILDQVIMNQNLRTEDEIDDKSIILEDVEDYIVDEGIDLSNTSDINERTIGF